MDPLELYVTAWLDADVDAIARAVTPDAVVTECYGPVYRGRARIHQWASTWFAAGGHVHSWRVLDAFWIGDRAAAEWIFDCTWRGSRFEFEGASVLTTRNGLICTLREYQTTHGRYEWTGEWRE